MSKVIISAEAKADLQEIYRYTDKRWGKSQAEKYLAQLKKRFQELGKSPNAGKPRPDVREGCRSIAIGKHVVLYEVAYHGVRVNAVVHVRRDIQRIVTKLKGNQRV